MPRSKEEIKEAVRCYQFQRLQTLISRLQSEVKPDDDAYTMNCHWLLVREFVSATSANAAMIEQDGRK
jgi:hypothetical protein